MSHKSIKIKLFIDGIHDPENDWNFSPHENITSEVVKTKLISSGLCLNLKTIRIITPENYDVPTDKLLKPNVLEHICYVKTKSQTVKADIQEPGSETDNENCLLEGKFQMLKITPACASGFAASLCTISENCGFTATFPCPFMRPRIVIDQFSALADTIPNQLEMTDLENSLSISILPYKIHETMKSRAELCVESLTGNALETYFSFNPDHIGIKYKRQMYLHELIYVKGGVASDGSYSNGIVYSVINDVNIGTAVCELKDTALAPLEQHGQIHATASNLCLGQLKHGLIYDECCVAFLASNGQLFQFGYLTLLYPAFPVMHMTSPVIDAQDSAGLQLVAKHLHIMREFCRKQDVKLRMCSAPAVGEVYVALDDRVYHQKLMKDVFNRCASKLQSILRMFKIFQRLYEHKIEEPVLPVAILSGKLNQQLYMSDDRLLFPKLSKDYLMGVPVDEEDFNKYLNKLKQAYKSMHAAGVVHLDGYPSNILWKRQENGEIIIRFVDFDVATFLDSNFDFGIQQRLDSSIFKNSFYYGVEDSCIARVKHDAWFVYIFSQMNKPERVQSQEAAKIYSADGVVQNYWHVVARMRQSSTFVTDFNTWFQISW